MKRLITFALILFVIMGYSQTKKIYTNAQFDDLSKNHQVLAIVPFNVTMKLRPNQAKKMTVDEIKEMNRTEGKAVQSALQLYFLDKQQKGKFDISFQDVAKTNAILTKNNIDYESIEKMTIEELAKLLNVDGIISGSLITDKPMSTGASVALGVFAGFYGATNSGKCTININDGTTGKLLWKYEKTLARSLGSDTNTVINAIMRKAARKFPYIIQ